MLIDTSAALQRKDVANGFSLGHVFTGVFVVRPICTFHWIDIAYWESDDLNRSPLRSRFPCRSIIDPLLGSSPSLDEVLSWGWIDPTVLPAMSHL